MLNIGILGCGTITRVRHAPEYAANPDCRIAAFADTVFDRALELAGLYHADAYGSCEELLLRDEIDAVSICTANRTHASLARFAMEHGKHVLCEKPMALTPEESEMLVDVSRSTGCLLVPAHNQRLFRSQLKAKQLLADGAMGRVISFRTCFTHAGPESWSIDSGDTCWFFMPEAGYGVLSDLAVHKLDALNDLLGEPITEVAADLATLDKKKADGSPVDVCDHAYLLCRTTSGIHGTVTASWSNYGNEENTIVLYCEKGRLVLNPTPEVDLLVEYRNGESIEYRLGGTPTNGNQKSSGVINAFVDAILQKRLPFATAKDGFVSATVMETAVRAPISYMRAI